MKLFENPIFLTQKRLVHRGGVLAAILIAALIGASLLAGIIAYLADPTNFPKLRSSQEAGKNFYGIAIAVEILVLIVGGFSRISRTLADERKAGLWDSNRLTPLKSSQLVIGYWLGSPLREFYMAAILAGIGLAIVVLAKLSITLWLGTQILIFSTALFLGLLAVLLGMIFHRPFGILIILPLFAIWAFSFFAPSQMLTNFLVPAYGIGNLFTNGENFQNNDSIRNWHVLPEIFGLPVYPVLLSLILQTLVGIFLWRAAIRKTTNPFRPPLFRWEAVAIFAILLLTQHGLIWNLWNGHFPTSAKNNHYYSSDYESLVAIVHGGTILLAIVILAAAGLQPETVRLKILRQKIKSLGAIFSESSVALAFVLAVVAGAILLTQFMYSTDSDSWEIYFITLGNLLSFFLIFSLLLEFCRLRHKRRALGFVALWLFVLCILPFVLGGVFTNSAFAKLSLLAPAVVALADHQNQDLNNLLVIVAAHFGIVILLFLGWRRQWKQLLTKAV